MAKVGIVLSGGIAKGAYQVGVLKAISERFSRDEIVCISSASIGSINAYAYSTSNLELLEKLWLDINREGKNTKYITSLLHEKYLDTVLGELCVNGKPVNNKLYISLFNFSKMCMEYKELSETEPGKISDYLRAGISLPPFFKPYFLEKNLYFDGALCDNIPIYPLVDCELDYIFCVHFDSYNYVFESTKFDNKTVKINFCDKSLIFRSISFNKDQIRRMIDDGYEKTAIILDNLLKYGNNELEYIYKRIEKMQAAFGEDRSLRITVDVVMDNLNKVLKKLLKRYKK